MAKKRGKLSTADEEFIKKNANKMDVSIIAETLNRHVEPVLRFIHENNLVHSGLDDEEAEFTKQKQKLQRSVLWSQIEPIFTKEELEYFVELWIKLVGQFQGEGILTTEQLQMKELITIDILSTRVLRENREALQELEDVVTKLKLEELKSEETQDAALISLLRGERDALRMATASYIKANDTLLERKKGVYSQLKATRADRVKEIESAKDSWPAYLKYLDNEETRKAEGETIELLRMSAEKSREKLSQYHEYEDGIIDQPLLTPESVLLMEGKDNDTQSGEERISDREEGEEGSTASEEGFDPFA